MHDIVNNVSPAKPDDGFIVQLPIFGLETVVMDRLFINAYFGSSARIKMYFFFFFQK